MLLVFALTLFTSALLLFLVQPMVGKMVTPLLGGTPAVWNTCMVFFQALLLAGYAYAHASSAWLGARKQAVLHLLVLLAPLAFFPLAVDRARAIGADRDPVVTVLILLAGSVGVPFLVVSTSAPLLQKWFASTDHPAARDPYFLYGASNLGSMLALLGYPTLVEPGLRLANQRWAWCVGYAVLAALVAGCAACLWRSPPAKEPSGEAPPPVGDEPSLPVPPDAFADRPGPGRGASRAKKTMITDKPAAPPPVIGGRVTALRRLRWVALAAVPSSLMLGATTYMTTDIAAIPLLWVLPLALYLLSFIIVFSKIPEVVQAIIVSLAAIGLTAGIAWRVPAFLGTGQPWTLVWAVWAACGVSALLSLRLLFVRDDKLLHRAFVLAMPLFVLLLLFVMLMLGGTKSSHLLYIVILHLTTLFVVAMVCHGELALDRPAPRHLTEFFLWMSLGGVLGGLFNALVAPLVFNAIIEYQLALVVACFLVPPLTAQAKEGGWNLAADLVLLVLFLLIGGLLLGLRLYDGDLDFAILKGETGVLAAAGLGCGLLVALVNLLRKPWPLPASACLDAALPLALVVLVAGLCWGLDATQVSSRVQSFAQRLNMNGERLRDYLAFGVPAVLCYTFVERPLRFGLTVGALALTAGVCATVLDHPEYQNRSFFGVLRVERKNWRSDGGNHLESTTLMHGTTLHGTQYRDRDDAAHDLALRQKAVTYYDATGPVGHLFAAYNTDPSRPYGVIGLGTGTMASYALPGQHVTFYDIDPVVRGISYDTDEYFTFVSDARGRGARIDLVMGDARLTMEQQRFTDDEKYGLLVVDAFSSDAIPIHLITQEALRLYFDHMRPDGIVLFHISNYYLDLQPVLANLAAREGLAGCVFSDGSDGVFGKLASTWVALARKPEHLGRLLRQAEWSKAQPALRAATLVAGNLNAPWEDLNPDARVGVWTDDYSNLLSVFYWRW